MSFRSIIAVVATIFLFAGYCGNNAVADAGAHHSDRSGTSKPNIVLFYVDDLGYGDVGFTGHPSTHTPNIDSLAYNGKILTSWYSGCSVCSGSRAALLTGRQYTRIGTPGVFNPDSDVGLPQNETTIASQLKKAGYSTGCVGKWHLGQRDMYLPLAHGFDTYLGIPYSDDMGEARRSGCNNASDHGMYSQPNKSKAKRARDAILSYAEGGFTRETDYVRMARGEIDPEIMDPAVDYLPLLYQYSNGTSNFTQVLEQPLDFTQLGQKYNDFAQSFLRNHSASSSPFFLYMPFSHVHTTASNQPALQYAGCTFQNTSSRGPFGDALAEVDWMVGNVVQTLKEEGIYNNTLIIFSGDNGPWMIKQLSAGSPGLFFATAADYWNVGKGSTWEGGIREASFVHWNGVITPTSRTNEVVSALDVFPTLSKLTGIPLPTDRIYDGKDATDVWFGENGGKSPHEFLFFYNDAFQPPSAVRYGSYKAHFRTSPGLGGCSEPDCYVKHYSPAPLLFNISQDPSEAYPLTTNGTMPADPSVLHVVNSILSAYEEEVKTLHYGKLHPAPGSPPYGVCCDRSRNCDCNGNPYI
eukprot:m.137228 g.137228  ORF g.137228 m.137228 type:complete len:580 (+) comp11468_c0_seq1:204-1943(+)